MSGMISPVRTGSPSSGSETPGFTILSNLIGFDHVAPLFSERMTVTLKPRVAPFLVVWIRLKILMSSPCGRTTIWLPMVCCRVPGSKMIRGSSQEVPPLVVLVNSVGPRKAMAFSPAIGFVLPEGGDTRRSQIAYTKLESLGSAVIEFLSFRRFGLCRG